jgi:outer membrane protein OmpU
MRKILLATTALAAFAGFSSAANAQITVSLGGYTEFFGAIYDNNVVGGTHREFQLETEIVVKADGKADNGLLYGVKVELQNSTGPGANVTANGTGVGTDEASIYVGGFWGRLELGDFDGASDTLAIFAPLVGVESIDGDYVDFVSVGATAGAPATSRTAYALGNQPWNSTTGAVKNPDSSDASKVMYLTPRFAGFQAGFSYTPENGNEAQDVITTKNARPYSDFLEYGINYTGDFSGVTVAASATGTSGNGRGGPLTGATVALKDFSAWQVGGQVGYAGFKIGGGYVDADNFNVPVRTDSGDQHAWNAGISYTTGPVAVGVTYMDAEGYKAAPSGTGAAAVGTYAEKYELYGVSGAYTVAPGLILQSDLMFFDEDLKRNATTATKVGNDGYVWLISTRVNF